VVTGRDADDDAHLTSTRSSRLRSISSRGTTPPRSPSTTCTSAICSTWPTCSAAESSGSSPPSSADRKRCARARCIGQPAGRRHGGRSAAGPHRDADRQDALGARGLGAWSSAPASGCAWFDLACRWCAAAAAVDVLTVVRDRDHRSKRGRPARVHRRVGDIHRTSDRTKGRTLQTLSRRASRY
jgi:hypothetical protein